MMMIILFLQRRNLHLNTERMQPLVNLLHHLCLEGRHLNLQTESVQPFVQGGRDVGGICDV